MEAIRISFKDILPNVRYANLLQCSPSFVDGPRKIYDHQFIYVHRGKGIIEVNGTAYDTLPGDLFFYGPGVTHTFYADAQDPYLISGIHFDFTRDYLNLSFPIGPFSINLFKQNLMTPHIEFTDFKGFPPRINLSGEHRVRETILQIVREYETGKLFSHNYINGLFSILLSIIARYIILEERGDKSKNGVIDHIIKFIQQNYDKKLSNKCIAEHFHFHPNYLNKLMVAHTGIPLRQYIIDLRIKKALDMIINTNMNIYEISKSVGYEDIHYFSRLFKKKTGYAPMQIKRKV